MSKVKVIETRYNGRLFRSRLEARWAVFFDSLRIRYDYEPEGFKLPSGWYLPDFYLPEFDSWIEIKPTEPSDHELRLASELDEGTGRPVYLFAGRLFLPVAPNDPAAPGAHFRGDWPYLWCECLTCGLLGIQFDGRSDRLPCRVKCPRSPHGDRDHTYNSPRLKRAYEAALSARFEHGRSG